MNRHSSIRDVTGNVKVGGQGMNVDLLFMCGTAAKPHKGSRVGAHMRGTIPWRCAVCVVALPNGLHEPDPTA